MQVFAKRFSQLFFPSVLFFSFFSIILSAHTAVGGKINDRQKVGLVLSGGGARTGAQVGVLRVLEELNIPVDFIAATSTGALIGALYATGLSPDEIEKALLAIDWDVVLRERLFRERLYFKRKQDDLNFLVKYKFALDGIKISLPKSILSPHKLNLAVKNLIFPSIGITDFDDLPVPFRAVSADLETGREVILGKGKLSEAVMASMAVPGVLAPLKMEEKWLIDGGIVNNIPVDVAREMGADIVIAVNVTTPLKKVDEPKSFLSTADQTINMQTQMNALQSLENLGESDIAITPELDDIWTYNFSRFGQAIQRGEKEARKLKERLARLSLSRDDYSLYLKERGRLKREMPVIEKIRFANETRLSERVIKRHFRMKEGEELDLNVLERDIAKLYHLDSFDSIDYYIATEDDHKELIISTRKKPAGNDFIRFGLNLITSTRGGTRFDFATSYTMTQISGLNAEWKTELRFGYRHELLTEFHQPLDYGLGFFIAPQASISNRTADIYSLGTVIDANRYNNALIGISLGHKLGRWGQARAGILRGWGHLETRIGGAVQGSGNSGGGAYFGKLLIDTLDNIHFPNNGILSDLEWTHSAVHLGSQVNSDTMEISFLAAKTWGYHSLVMGFDGGMTLNSNEPLNDNFTLGGFLNLSGFREDAIAGKHKLLAKLIYYLKVSGFSKGLLTFPVYLGASFESGNAWLNSGQIDFDSLIWAGSAFIGIDTIIGPIYFGVGLREGWKEAIYLSMGRTF